MKKYINRVLLLSGCAMALAACDENSWNDEYLPGFDADKPLTEVKTIEYTLTAEDYKAIASNATNKALAGEDGKDALAAVGTQGYFTSAIPANDYVPAFLASTSFPYFTLNNGSAVKLTYNVAENLPEEINEIAAAPTYIVTEENYQEVWESENDYTAAFTPSHPASKSLPKILKAVYPDAAEGQYVIVNYEESAVDPVFTQTPEPPEPGFTLSSVIKDAAKGDNVTINGYVSAVSTQGFILTDASGSIFVYRKPTEPFADIEVGSQIVLDGIVNVNNYGKQIDTGSTYEVEGKQTVEYPAFTVLTGADLDAMKAVADAAYAEDKNAGKNLVVIEPYYVKLSGTVKVSGTNINILVEGADAAQGSVYGAPDNLKEVLTKIDGSNVELSGYLIAIAGGRYFNIVVCDIMNLNELPVAASLSAGSRAVEVASENVNALYSFNGTSWTVADDAVVLSHADYQAMGQRYDNLSGESPAALLPLFLKNKCPYAQVDDHKFVAYAYYNGSETVIRCDYYKYTGSEWLLDNGVVTETAQFVKAGGKWLYDPNVTIILPVGRNIEISTLYFQTCVDWVKNNVPDGAAYVSSYGNNEYYCGTSAYQGNVDLRPSAAKAQYAGYADMPDDEIVALEKRRFESEVFPAALSIIHPDAMPIDGFEVLYTINFGAYQGINPTPTYDIVYKVVGKGQFEYVSCTWND